ncbi:hypothetical protein J7L48_11000 [bacterium]|nr:hypothetical protein [bacterium]
MVMGLETQIITTILFIEIIVVTIIQGNALKRLEKKIENIEKKSDKKVYYPSLRNAIKEATKGN